MSEDKSFIPDYSKYPLGELIQIRSRMQKDKFIDRIKAIDEEIIRKKEELAKNPNIENLEASSYNYEYASFGMRVAAKSLDGMVLLLLYPLTNFIHSFAFDNGTIIPIILETCIQLYLLEIFLVMKFGGTIGKLMMKLQVINIDGNYLDIKSAILRITPIIVLSIISILDTYHVMNSIPSEISSFGFFERTQLLHDQGEIYTIISLALILFIILDIGTVLLNDKKRAIHDFIAGSYVVTESSIDLIDHIKSKLNHT